jgi:hypothetical protein
MALKVEGLTKPFEGLLRISNAPLQEALSRLGQ